MDTYGLKALGQGRALTHSYLVPLLKPICSLEVNVEEKYVYWLLCLKKWLWMLQAFRNLAYLATSPSNHEVVTHEHAHKTAFK